LIDISKK